MKPLFKYPGGKYNEINFFKKYYPKKFNLFIEPFVGGGAVFFDLNFNNNIIVDFNEDLVNFYEVIKKGFSKEIYQEVKKIKNDKMTFYFVRDDLMSKNNIEKAIRFYYLRKTCFRGLSRYNKNGKFNVPYGNYKKVDCECLLEKKYENLLKKTIILNKSFEYIFKKCDNENNFIFLDPPYHEVFNGYSSFGFTEEDHRRLFECFKKSKNKCLLIIGKTDFINNLYKDYIIDEYNKKYAMTVYKENKPNKIHLIIKNY